MGGLFISKTKDTPEIDFSIAKKTFKISGICLPENALDFFIPIIEWIKHYLAKQDNNIKFIFDLDYFNTATAKVILEILEMLSLVQVIFLNLVWLLITNLMFNSKTVRMLNLHWISLNYFGSKPLIFQIIM